MNHDPRAEPVLLLLQGVAADSPLAHCAAQSDPRWLPLHPLDLGITRGDGVFEAIGVIAGRPLELEAHLRRIARSAKMLDLPELRIDAIAEAVRLAISRHAEVAELLVKVFVTRGPEHRPEPTAWIYAAEGPDYSSARRDGIAVISLNRGYPRDIARTAPWLLQGAKTLSYAVNRSALREAERQGAQDAIFVSSDGYVLEGPASTVILRDSRGYWSPAAEDGVLPGTTQARIFEGLEAAGFRTHLAPVREEELMKAEALWLVSSGRMVVPVHTIDGRTLPVDSQISELMSGSLLPDACILYT